MTHTIPVVRKAYNLFVMRTAAESPRKVAIRADVERDLALQVKQAALNDGRSVAGWVRRVLAEHIESEDTRG